MFSPLLPLCQPDSISLAVTLSCVFSFPAVLRLLHPLSRSRPHHKLLTPCVCRNMPHHWGVGKKRSLALCQTHTPSNSVFPARLPRLQGKLPEPTEQLLAQTTRPQGLSPAVALCPSPCAHTHFPLHTDAAQLTRDQAAGVSKPPEGRPGRKETQEQAAIFSGAGSPSGLSIPLSKEQHCLTRYLHGRHLSLSS